MKHSSAGSEGLPSWERLVAGRQWPSLREALWDLVRGTIRVSDERDSVAVITTTVSPPPFPPYRILLPGGLHDSARLHTPRLAVDSACATLIRKHGMGGGPDPREELSAFVSAFLDGQA